MPYAVAEHRQYPLFILISSLPLLYLLSTFSLPLPYLLSTQKVERRYTGGIEILVV